MSWSLVKPHLKLELILESLENHGEMKLFRVVPGFLDVFGTA